MENVHGHGMANGLVSRSLSEDSLVCQYVHMVGSKGLWLGYDPFDYSFPLLMAQLIWIFFVTRTIYFFLKPLGQSMTTAQVIAGIIIGPSFLGHSTAYADKLFPLGGIFTLETIADIGFMLHLFLLGVQMDMSILKKAGRNAVLIGTTGFALAYALGGLTYLTMSRVSTLDKTLSVSLPFIVAVNSMSSFPVITSLLADLNILNSELGRLATSTSMVSDLCSWSMATIMTTMGIAVRDSHWTSLWSIVWIAGFFVTITYILRPLILQIAKRTPEGKPMKEIHFLAILLIVLGCGFCTEVLGQHAGFGPFILGMAIPDGPPLGAALVNKLDSMATGLLLPVTFGISGLRTNLFSIGGSRSLVIIELVIILGYIGKFTGTLLPAIYCAVPFRNALSLALIMGCKGIIEVATYSMWRNSKILDNQSYTLLLITMLIVTGVSRPMVAHLYDPSRRYMTYRRRTILHSKHNIDLRVLVCIHNEDNVPSIINLLEASNPTKDSAISIYVLHLMELSGRASAILVPHQHHSKLTSNQTHLEHIVNAFNYYEKHNQGRVMVQHYNSVAPYASMHDDICMLALDKMATIVIVPFHKQWTIDGTVGTTIPSIRTVNRHVIDKAPCSVGVLVDRSPIGSDWSAVLTGRSLYCIALLFLGGADDREALAYGRRMAEHPTISLTVVWFKPQSHDRYSNEKEKTLDSELVNDFRATAVDTERIIYKEETVKDGVGTTQIVRSMEDAFDLFIVGRHHEPESPLTLGLTDWSECPELGVIGDMLATSDFTFSVLIVQQQPLRVALLDNNPNLRIANHISPEP